MAVILAGEGFRLRPWQREDWADLVRCADNFNIWLNLRDGFPHPYTREAAEKWLETALSQDDSLLLAIEVEGAAAGGIGAHFLRDVYRKNCEIGYWLAELFWGRGIMTAAVHLLTGHIFSNYPEIHRAYADLFAYNSASARVLEKNGFHREAVHREAVIKNGKLTDEYRYVKFRP